jgi:hypothetical protein
MCGTARGGAAMCGIGRGGAAMCGAGRGGAAICGGAAGLGGATGWGGGAGRAAGAPLAGGPFFGSCGCADALPAIATDNAPASSIALLAIIALSTGLAGTRTF